MKRWTKNFLSEEAGRRPQISVVMAVYNKPRELHLCLEGYRRQSFLDENPKGLQLILADDGSSPEIEALFEKFANEVPFVTTYLSQPHQGWGKLRMLNWAVLEALADQLIFTDGDCFPHIHFLKNHFEYFEERTVSCGRRPDLAAEISEQITVEDIKAGVLDSNLWLLKNILKKQAEYGGHGFYLPEWLSKIVRKFSKSKIPTLLGSNFSIHKKWLLEVNGFDETFTTPGIGEDTDIERRLTMLGLKLKWITHRAVQFHLWHPTTVVGEKTWNTFEMLKNKGSRTALKGIKELQEELRKTLP